jgi:hypothetical protein
VRSRFTQDLRPGAFSAVPAGLIAIPPQELICFQRVLSKSAMKKTQLGQRCRYCVSCAVETGPALTLAGAGPS